MASGTSGSASFLLLLPPVSSPSSHDALNQAYGDTLSQVLKEALSASNETRDASVLEVALACPHLVDAIERPRRESYQATQSLVAGLYKLICIIAAKDKINIEDADGIDVRVILVAWSPDTAILRKRLPYGPVIDLKTLATCQRPWQYAFGVETEQGAAFVQAFVAAKNGSQHHHQHDDTRQVSAKPEKATKTLYSHVAVGGTFDHIHLGHKLLLTMTLYAVDEQDQAANERSVVVGITGDELLKNKKYAEQLESWHERQQSSHRFLESLFDFSVPGSDEPVIKEVHAPGPNGHAVNIRYPCGLTLRYVEIADPFGPTITDEDISALILSGETRSGGQAVNDKRTEKGWKALDVYEVDVLDPEDGAPTSATQGSFQSKISSTEIRRKLSAKTSSVL